MAITVRFISRGRWRSTFTVYDDNHVVCAGEMYPVPAPEGARWAWSVFNYPGITRVVTPVLLAHPKSREQAKGHLRAAAPNLAARVYQLDRAQQRANQERAAAAEAAEARARAVIARINAQLPGLAPHVTGDRTSVNTDALLALLDSVLLNPAPAK